jgi:hypothetical protein
MKARSMAGSSLRRPTEIVRHREINACAVDNGESTTLV